MLEAKEKEESEDKKSQMNEDSPRKHNLMLCVECCLVSCQLQREGHILAEVCWSVSCVS